MISLDQLSFSIMAVCSVRYALGKETVEVKDIAEIVLANLQYLEADDLEGMIHDICNSPRSHGAGEMTWKAFCKRLSEQLASLDTNGFRRCVSKLAERWV
jgi:hypothetical protein